MHLNRQNDGLRNYGRCIRCFTRSFYDDQDIRDYLDKEFLFRTKWSELENFKDFILYTLQFLSKRL